MRMVAMLGMVACLATAGCGSEEPGFDHLEYSRISLAPDTAELMPNQIRLAEGTAVQATVQVVDTDDEALESYGLSPETTSVFGAEPGANEKAWVFFGRAQGTTRLTITRDGRRFGSVAVEVVPQSLK